MIKIAIYGNYATQFFIKALRDNLKKLNLSVEIYQADYNQADIEFYDLGSKLFSFKPDYIILHESIENLKDNFYSFSQDQRETFANTALDRLASFSNILYENLPKTKMIYPDWESDLDMAYGNFYPNIPQSLDYQIRKFNWKLFSLINESKNIITIDSNRLTLIVNEPKNYSLSVNADLQFSLKFLDLLSIEIGKIIKSITGTTKKCIILDLDNTLWGGVIGDDGIEGIEIGNLGIGKAFSKFQKWLKQLKNRGIILTVCSKNTESVAKEPFEKHQEMVLKLADIAVFVANWENKADNIRHIQSVLNIGFDSMVFIDDNPAERKIVIDNLPEVTVPELPEDPAYFLKYIQELNLFETFSISDNDKDRTKQYQEEAKRVEFSKSITNIDDYLKSLEMTASIEPFKKDDFSRIAQLTQRSNQFNLRTIRYTEDEIEKFANNNDYLTFSVKLKDKFGDYGLISVVIVAIKQNEAFIDTWLMSCRVLKRGVEHIILNELVSKLKDQNVNNLIGEYIPSSKNALVADHFKKLGFVDCDNHHYLLEISNYKNLDTHINKD